MRTDLSRATTPAQVEAAMESLGEVLGAMRAGARRHLVRQCRGGGGTDETGALGTRSAPPEAEVTGTASLTVRVTADGRCGCAGRRTGVRSSGRWQRPPPAAAPLTGAGRGVGIAGESGTSYPL